MTSQPTLMDKILSLTKRRGFIFPGSEIYGGLANSWDYGPLGAEMKKNIKDEWWRRFVRQRTDMVGLDAALIMNPRVWEASGHLKNFSDPLIECKQCNERFRADQLESLEQCPACKAKKSFTEAKQFNMMLKTSLGPKEDTASTAYLRPETAQAMFVQFKNILETTRKRLPFGIAQMGRAFRNEITPGNFIFRQREFDLMELEYFVKPEEWEQYFEHWLSEMKRWLKDLGVSEQRLHYAEIPAEERAHYSKRTVDVEYDYPFGRKELYGLAYRTDFDLVNHDAASRSDLKYTNPEDPKDKFFPHVIEPAFGLDRSVLVALLEAYHEEQVEDGDVRVVLRLPKWVAPVKVAILPLSKKDELSQPALKLQAELSKHFVCDYDETQSIGKRYRRQDEIGTPYCVTFDFETLNDQSVTVRDRDTMKQERVKIDELVEYLKQRFS